MTTVEESTFTPVGPNQGRTATAKARAAATGETAPAGGLRAQPRAGARARQTVAAAGAKYQEVREHRRAVTAARESAPAAVGEARDSIWEARPPSLAELARRAAAGPVTPVRRADGTIVEESADWPDWQVFAWKVYAFAELGLVAAPTYALLYCSEKPGRAGGLLLLVGFAVFLGWYGGEIAATADGVAP